MTGFWIGFATFPVVAIIVTVAWVWVDYLLSKDIGVRCRVRGCDFEYKIGDKRRVTLLFLWKWHRATTRNEKRHVEFFDKLKERK